MRYSFEDLKLGMRCIINTNATTGILRHSISDKNLSPSRILAQYKDRFCFIVPASKYSLISKLSIFELERLISVPGFKVIPNINSYINCHVEWTMGKDYSFIYKI